MAKQLETVLRSVVAFLENHGYRYALIGGIALPQWGVIRATQDIDIKIAVPDTDYAAVRAALRAAFPTPARPDAPENPFIVAVVIDEIVIDFLLALPGYEELIIKRAIQRDLGGWSAWVCSAEDLIIQKIVAGRSKDWDDVESLLIEQGGKLDQAYIEEWLAQFAEALEQPDLLTKYQQMLAQARVLTNDE